jgi:hypothetical protein
VRVVSPHADYHPVRALTLSGQHAAKVVEDRTDPTLARIREQLLSGRIRIDVAKRLDVGVLASTMWGNDGGRQSAVGGELGIYLLRNLWLSLGYKLSGFTDKDQIGSNYTSRGAYARLRLKVD